MAENSRNMRHIPRRRELIRRVDVVLRARADVALRTVEKEQIPPELRERVETLIVTATRWIDRAGDLARRGRNLVEPHHSPRIMAALDRTTEALGSVDEETWAVAAPSEQFDPSRWEPLWEAILAAGYALDRALDALNSADGDVWWEVLDTSSREHLPIELPAEG